jgi:hypothetical protein
MIHSSSSPFSGVLAIPYEEPFLNLALSEKLAWFVSHIKFCPSSKSHFFMKDYVIMPLRPSNN